MRKLFLSIIFFCFSLVVSNIYAEKILVGNGEPAQFGVGVGSVGATGDYTYTFPMKNIKAVYNSASGWEVGQTSAITRSTKWGVPSYTDDDIFMLDGQELVYAGGDSTCRLYHTANESYLRIRYMYPGTSSSYWEVTGKDGKVLKYGFTYQTASGPDSFGSRVLAIDNGSENQPRMWAITESSDQFNNNSYYYYLPPSPDGSCYLWFIINSKFDRFEKMNLSGVALTYIGISNPEVDFRQGCKVSITKRVSQIVEYGPNSSRHNTHGPVVRIHKIGWIDSPETKTTLISSIQTYGSDMTSALPATIFSYASQPQNGTGFSSTVYDWGVIDTAFSQYPSVGIRESKQYGSHWQNDPYYDMVDMNGDGLLDRVQYLHPGSLSSSDPIIRSVLNTGNGFQRNSQAQLDYQNWMTYGSWASYFTWGCDSFQDSYGQQHVVFRLIDLHGDGLPDLVAQNLNLANGNMQVWKNSGSSLDGSAQNWGSDSFPSGWKWLSITAHEDQILYPYGDIYYTYVDFFDINGDGLPDKVADFAGDYQQQDIAINTGISFKPRSTPETSVKYPNLHYYNAENWPYPYLRSSHTSGQDSSTRRDMRDMNGDGLVDKFAGNYVMFNNGRTGNTPGYEKPVAWQNPLGSDISRSQTIDNGNTKTTLVTQDLIDMNGDGLPDLVNVDGNGVIWVYFNNGNGFDGTPVNYGTARENCLRKVISYKDGDWTYYNKTVIDMIDMNGDGLPDKVWTEGNNLRVSLNRNNNVPDRMLVQIINDKGGSSQVSYKAVNKQNNMNYKLKCWVVDKIVQTDGLSTAQGGVKLTNSYNYYGGVYNSQRREDRGFRRIVQTDPTKNKIDTYYFLDDIKVGLAEKVITRDSRGYIQSYVYNTYQDYAAISGNYANGITAQSWPNSTGLPVSVKAPKLVQSDTYLVSGTTSQDNGTKPAGNSWVRLKKIWSYDEFGNNTYVENLGEVDENGNDYNDGTQKSFDKKRTIMGYAINNANWIMVPKSKHIQGTDSGSTIYQTQYEEYYFYDKGNDLGNWEDNGVVYQGRLKAVQRNNGTVDFPHYYFSEQLAYDTHGNVITKRNALNKDTTIMYDNIYHTYPTEIINPKGFHSYNLYDDLMRLTSKVDPNGIPIIINYDVFGRLSSVVKEGDSVNYPTVEKIYRDDVFPRCVITKKRKKAEQPETIDTYTYYDGMGRKVQTKQTGTDTSQWITKENWGYISRNTNIHEIRVPYVSDTFEFNRNGINQIPINETTRVKTLLCEYGSRKDVYYPDGSTTIEADIHLDTYYIDVNGKSQKNSKDGLGNLIMNQVYSDKYSFDPESLYRLDRMYYHTGTGNMIELNEDSQHNNLITKKTYNMSGWLTSYDDPDKGLTTYTYFDTKNILSQIDAVTMITNQYDSLNRIVQKTYIGNGDRKDEYYFYDEGGSTAYANNRLTRVEDESGTTVFKYDARGRVITNIKTIIGSGTAVNCFTYDSMDRVISQTYPDGEVLSQSYDHAGRLYQMGNPDQPDKYLKQIVYNDRGQIFGSEYGNGSVNLYSYYGSSGNYRLKTVQAYQSDRSCMLYNYYGYDYAGNITSINTGLDYYNQSFTYDFLNRLKGQNNENYLGGASSYTYDRINNIIEKNNVTYSYNTSKSHAVTSTSKCSGVYLYDSTGNMIYKGLSGLKAYWKFDKGSGTLVSDMSGNQYNGYISGAEWVKGIRGYALSFDGIDDYINIPGLDWTPTSFSVEFWLNPESRKDFNQHICAVNGWNAFVFHIQCNGAVHVGTDDGTGMKRLSPAELPAGTVELKKWQHFVFTFDNGTGKFYKNGILLAEKPGMPNPTAWGGMLIGVGDARYLVHGKVDDIAVWDKVLTSKDVLNHYTQNKPSDPDIMSYWKFNKGGGTMVWDSSMNGNNGTINNDPIWVKGIEGNSIGYGTCVSCPNSSSLNITGDITIEAWIKTVSSENGVIVLKYNDSVPEAPGYALVLNGSGKLWFWHGGGWAISSDTVNDGKWHHIAVTGNNTAGTFYIDGAVDSTFTFETIKDNASADLHIGYYKGVEGEKDFFHGKIDEIVIRKNALSLSEIQQQYQKNQPVLAGYWKFDEGFDDSSVNERNGGPFNGAEITDDFGLNNCLGINAVNYDPNGPHVLIDNHPCLNITEDITIEAWIRGNGGVIMAKCQTASPWNGFIFEMSPNGQLKFWIANQPYYSSVRDINDSKWHHVAVSASKSTGKGKFYIDGEECGSFPYSGIPDSIYYQLVIGGWPGGQSSFYCFRGCLDEVAIWKKALTQEEIYSHYERDAILIPNSGYNEKIGALAMYNMDDGNVSEIKDSTGRGMTGNINGAVYKANKGVCHTGAYQFDWKSQNNILIPCNFQGLFFSKLTVSAWVYPTAFDNTHTGCNRIVSEEPVYVLQCMNGVPDFRVLTEHYGLRQVSGTTALSLNQWHYLVGIFDGENVKLYVDGVLVATDQLPGGSCMQNTQEPIAIGESPGLNEGFSGLIDNVGIYLKVHLDEMIASIYNRLIGDSQDISLDSPYYQFCYDAANRLISIKGDATANYVYDYTGTRVKKTEGNTTVYSFNSYYELENGKTNKYYFAKNSPIAQKKKGALSYLHLDHQGSVVRLSDETGNEIKRMGYMPYGEYAYASGSGVTPTVQYTGQENDSTGLYYYGARYYDPELSKFITLDAYGDNYTYCGNNPVIRVDSDGNWWWVPVTLAAINTLNAGTDGKIWKGEAWKNGTVFQDFKWGKAGIAAGVSAVSFGVGSLAASGVALVTGTEIAGMSLLGQMGTVAFSAWAGSSGGQVFEYMANSVGYNLSGDEQYKQDWNWGEYWKKSLISAGVGALATGVFSPKGLNLMGKPTSNPYTLNQKIKGPQNLLSGAGENIGNGLSENIAPDITSNVSIFKFPYQIDGISGSSEIFIGGNGMPYLINYISDGAGYSREVIMNLINGNMNIEVIHPN